MEACDDLITSELHEELGSSEAVDTLARLYYSLWSSHSADAISQPSSRPSIDEDGDLEPPRRSCPPRSCITVHCSVQTPLSSVGLQLWRAAFLLSDFLLSQAQTFKSSTLLELGCGCGLSSMIASHHIPNAKIFATDFDITILKNCVSNIELNRNEDAAPIEVKQLDWMKPVDAQFTSEEFAQFSWTQNDAAQLESLDYILGADLIYDYSLTDALVRTLRRLFGRFKQFKSFYMTTEARITFSVSDLEARARMLDYFFEQIEVVHYSNGKVVDRREPTQPSMTPVCLEVRLEAFQFDLDTIPQCFQYDRTGQLQFWEIRRIP